MASNIELKEGKIYIIMNKPSGVVCSSVSDSHKTVFDLLPSEYKSLLSAKRGARLHTVGRLDSETTGLLLITDDGEFSHKLVCPESHVAKKYAVVLETSVNEENQRIYIEKFAKGLRLPAEKKALEVDVKGAKLEFLNEKECLVTVTEGKFHQIRRMFLAVGNMVAELKRISFGDFVLSENLKEGDFNFLTI